MFVAEDENGNRIYATLDTDRDKGYYCPVCRSGVRLRSYKVENQNAPHFAHVSLQECADDYTNDMSEWHRNWQELFPKGNREVVIEHPETGEKHRADVLCYGTVIEFQHSPISETEFWRRNQFYTSVGYRVVWVFDVIDLYNGFDTVKRMDCVSEWHNKYGSGGKYRWKYPWRFLEGFIPQDESKIDIFFQIVPLGDNPKEVQADCCIEKVTWINTEYRTIWGWFHTSYEVINYFELLQWLKKRWLREK